MKLNPNRRNGVHPTVVSTFSGDDYIPNDIVVGIKDEDAEDAEEEEELPSSASTVLVTGFLRFHLCDFCVYLSVSLSLC